MAPKKMEKGKYIQSVFKNIPIFQKINILIFNFSREEK
jgi:hypothetical protein